MVCAFRLAGCIEGFGGFTAMPESQPVEVATIGRDELKEKIARKDKFVLVETLPAQYYNHDHLPGAINLPPDEIAQSAPKVLPDKTAEIIVYCAKLT
jgi:rhodanese-related sulfurtransferase